MFKFVAFATLLVCATAAPATVNTGPDDTSASITAYDNQINADGSFAYKFETSNGINIQEAGTATGTVQGSVQYQSPEGEPIQLTYVADEQGYQPTGAHLPTPPPIPDLIQKSLAYIEAHPPPPEVTGKPV